MFLAFVSSHKDYVFGENLKNLTQVPTHAIFSTLIFRF